MRQEPDTTAVLDRLREAYGQGAWAGIRSDRTRACGDGLGAVGIADDWWAALNALFNSRMHAATERRNGTTTLTDLVAEGLLMTKIRRGW